MAVWTFKDGEKELVEPELLDGQLAGGWSVTDPSVEEVAEVAEEPAEEEKK